MSWQSLPSKLDIKTLTHNLCDINHIFAFINDQLIMTFDFPIDLGPRPLSRCQGIERLYNLEHDYNRT